MIDSSPISGSSPSIAARAEPAITGISSPGKSYELRSSRISISTSSKAHHHQLGQLCSCKQQEPEHQLDAQVRYAHVSEALGHPQR